MNPSTSKAQIPPSPHQYCPFIRAQTYNTARLQDLEASTKYEEQKNSNKNNKDYKLLT
ncbi:MAG: hypothetical protein ACJ72Q_02490 [Nitrososphaeraceae archaeon]|jgi:hypothetical protein